ncbi:hypothetical protein [Faecalispora anaeroviscerum]|uniref:hypothetical protein n=1 Tax=Faecalispora anaeroviscerum TaxID=2991836 RepID=UPI0024BB21E7|nr:hypothetical protein [Faecalispora anaeroviscerum]
MYYLYDSQAEVYAKSDTQPESGDYCTSDIDFDLDLYTVYVGAVSADKQLTYYTQRAKPAEQLAQIIKSQQAENVALHQAQSDSDLAALDLDYRLTLLENGVKVGEI